MLASWHLQPCSLSRTASMRCARAHHMAADSGFTVSLKQCFVCSGLSFQSSEQAHLMAGLNLALSLHAVSVSQYSSVLSKTSSTWSHVALASITLSHLEEHTERLPSPMNLSATTRTKISTRKTMGDSACKDSERRFSVDSETAPEMTTRFDRFHQTYI